MWTKSISNILGMGIFGSCFLAANLPVQGQIMIQGGNLSGNLNYNYDNPIVPVFNGLTGLDVNSFNLETDIGRISNFQGTGQLKEVSNLAGILFKSFSKRSNLRSISSWSLIVFSALPIS